VTTVLVATDAEWVFEDVDAALGDQDTTVYRVHAGRDVVPAFHQVDPDLVVLDLQIGNQGGVATALLLRQEQEVGRLPACPILMLLDRSADVFMARYSRSDGWLVKPLDAFRLRRAAAALLQGGEYHEGVEAARTG
jgi:DNA-binding response OmpR family regulator